MPAVAVRHFLADAHADRDSQHLAQPATVDEHFQHGYPDREREHLELADRERGSRAVSEHLHNDRQAVNQHQHDAD